MEWPSRGKSDPQARSASENEGFEDQTAELVAQQRRASAAAGATGVCRTRAGGLEVRD